MNVRRWFRRWWILPLVGLFFWMGRGADAAREGVPFLEGFPKSKIGTVAFGSPAVTDLDGDGSLEILTAGYGGCVRAWYADGAPVEGFPLDTSGPDCSGERINGPLALADLDGDGSPEILAGTRGVSNQPGQRGKVYVWHSDGRLLPGWPKEMDWNAALGVGRAEVYSVAAGKLLPGNGLQILAGTSNNAANSGDFNQDTRNLYAWSADGSLLSGYPTWYRTAGIWGQVAAADLNGDGLAEALTGRDHLYLHAYNASGAYLPGWPVRSFVDAALGTWDVHPYLEFTRAAPVVADLNGDGKVEIVAVGKVRSPDAGHAVVAAGVLVVTPEGERFPGWETAPLSGAPLYPEYGPSQAPSVADLDGDNRLEIIVPFFDGTLRAYQDDGSLWWQYDYAQGRTLFASEVAVGDVNGDGRVDLVFGTYSPDGSANAQAGIIALDAFGRPLNGFPLPLTAERGGIQGVRAAPTLTDLDGDCDVEIAAASMGNALYVWDLSAPYYPNRMPWPTSRQNNLRNGDAGGPALVPSACPHYIPPEVSPRIYLPFLMRP